MQHLALLLALIAPALAQEPPSEPPAEETPAPGAESAGPAEPAETAEPEAPAEPEDGPTRAVSAPDARAPAPQPPPEPAPARPLAIPSGEAQKAAIAADEARARAIRQYRSSYLEIRNWNQIRTSTMYTDVGWGAGYGYGYPYGWGGGWSVATPWVWSEERWSVYRGPQRLNNLQYLEVVGKKPEADDLARRIRKNRTVGGVLYGVGIAGGLAVATGLVGMDNAATLRSWQDWRIVAIAGTGSLFTGVVAGSFPAARARRLSSDPSSIRSWEALQDEMLDHNEALRVELGLSADDALRAEGAR